MVRLDSVCLSLCLGLFACGGSTATTGPTGFVCDPACPSGQACTMAGCAPLADLSASARDLETAADGGCGACPGEAPHCNASGQCVACLSDGDCPAGSVCKSFGAAPACVPGCIDATRCAPGQQCCGGACTDPTSDVGNCGGCGMTCAAPGGRAACVGGVCTVGACDPGFADCDKSPVNGCEVCLQADPQNCGACGAACALPNAASACGPPGACFIGACDFGWGDCDGVTANGCEASTLSDAKNCGDCGVACPALPHATNGCVNAGCQITACAAGWADCDGNPKNGCEVATDNDVNNCGLCGNVCGNNAICAKGGCTCKACVFPHLLTKCVNLMCLPKACDAGWGDCNFVLADGCETDLTGDAKNCGACGNACGGKTPYCEGGVCGNAAASCNDIKLASPNSADGVYTIDPDGGGPVQPYQVYCDMTTDGGGWTAFFAGTNGSPNVFNHFEDTPADCADPANKCLRRLPAAVTTAYRFMASCGAASLEFDINQTTLTYFQSGTQGGNWMNNSNQNSVAGGANVKFGGQTWTGQANNKGWIISAGNGQEPSTFACSYNLNNQWDWCNGVPDTASAVKLFYR